MSEPPGTTAPRDGEALRALAAEVGIADGYHAHDGRLMHTSDDARAAILDAMGFDVAGGAGARRALDELHAARAARVVDPTLVVSSHYVARRADDEPFGVHVHVPPALGGDVEWALRWRDESGAERRAEGRSPVRDDRQARVPLPERPTLGYHALRFELAGQGETRVGEQTLIVVPPRCPSPAELLGGERVAGIVANLYAVRSERNWGAGDVSDLATLVDLARDTGLAFVGVNPLHALRNRDGEISPYSPVSRLFRNVLYLDVEAVPELAESPEARAMLDAGELRRELRRLRDATNVDYDGVMRLKRPLLEALHRAFRARGRDARTDAYERWVAEQGAALERFAEFSVLDEGFRAEGFGWWREWPAEYQDPASPAVAAFAARRAQEVDFHRWAQFELDRQLGAVARRARAAGLPIGLYQDLAIGASPSGSDMWANPGLFLRGVSVGAPPDPLGPDGQNWGLPPLDPRRLRDEGYAYWRTLVRSAMGHAGALRIDHVLGLFRQFWIPDGMRGSEGTYVRFPSDELLGVVALEATRAGALVVGEDLGTVPPEVPPALERWGLLGSKVLYFERGDGGRFKGPREYPRLALTTATTHDLPTIAGFLRGRDIELRGEVGLLRTEEEVDDAERARAHDIVMLVRLLVEEGLLAEPPTELDEPTLRAAVHALLRRTPSWLVGISLDDLIGETEPVNLPGVAGDRFPSWTRRNARTLESLADDATVRRALGAERVWVPRPGSRDELRE